MRDTILIVGGGLAGLFCALKLAPRPVVVLTGAPLGEGASSAWAQGGVAAALSEGDTPEKHTADTIAAGAGIVDRDVVLGMAREARARIDDLLAYGVPFDKDLRGHLLQSREAAHSERRIVRVKGDAAGRAIMAALVAAVRRAPGVEVIEGYCAEDLLMAGPRVAGVLARDGEGRARAFPAAATVLATGGVGQIYAITTNPLESRGAGLAMAARAGAIVADAEFVQFHPTAIDVGRDPAPLATEALRGEGATLVDRSGRRFMVDLHEDAELAPRDVVARGVFAEIAAGRGAFLECRAAIGPEFPTRFPTVYASCVSAGIDPLAQPIPVAPAEHYHMGGVSTDWRGRASLAGLWAAGEVACTGVHGANRLASNSLLEAVVFGGRVADDLRGARLEIPGSPAPPAPASAADAAREAALVSRLRRTMTADVGVVRDGEGLSRAIVEIAAIGREAQGANLRNMALTALFVAVAARARRESRGGHYRTDYPAADPALGKRSFMTMADLDGAARAAAMEAGA